MFNVWNSTKNESGNVLWKLNSGLNRRITLTRVKDGDRGTSPDLTS